MSFQAKLDSILNSYDESISCENDFYYNLSNYKKNNNKEYIDNKTIGGSISSFVELKNKLKKEQISIESSTNRNSSFSGKSNRVDTFKSIKTDEMLNQDSKRTINNNLQNNLLLIDKSKRIKTKIDSQIKSMSKPKVITNIFGEYDNISFKKSSIDFNSKSIGNMSNVSNMYKYDSINKIVNKLNLNNEDYLKEQDKQNDYYKNTILENKYQRNNNEKNLYESNSSSSIFKFIKPDLKDLSKNKIQSKVILCDENKNFTQIVDDFKENISYKKQDSSSVIKNMVIKPKQSNFNISDHIEEKLANKIKGKLNNFR